MSDSIYEWDRDELESHIREKFSASTSPQVQELSRIHPDNQELFFELVLEQIPDLYEHFPIKEPIPTPGIWEAIGANVKEQLYYRGEQNVIGALNALKVSMSQSAIEEQARLAEKGFAPTPEEDLVNWKYDPLIREAGTPDKKKILTNERNEKLKTAKKEGELRLKRQDEESFEAQKEDAISYWKRKERVDAEIEEDVEMSGVLEWYNQPENEFEWGKALEGPQFGRAVGQMLASAGPVFAVGAVTGGFGALPTAYAMEAGNMMNEMMTILVEEEDLTPEDAYPIAAIASNKYGVMSMGLEAAVPFALTKGMGLGKAGKKVFARRLLSKAVDKAKKFSKTGKEIGENELSEIVKNGIKEVIKEKGAILIQLTPYVKATYSGAKKITGAQIGELLTEGAQYVEEKAIKISTLNKHGLDSKETYRYDDKQGKIEGKTATELLNINNENFWGSVWEDPEFHASMYGGAVGGGVMATPTTVSQSVGEATGRKGKRTAKNITEYLTGATYEQGMTQKVSKSIRDALQKHVFPSLKDGELKSQGVITRKETIRKLVEDYNISEEEASVVIKMGAGEIINDVLENGDLSKKDKESFVKSLEKANLLEVDRTVDKKASNVVKAGSQQEILGQTSPKEKKVYNENKYIDTLVRILDTSKEAAPGYAKGRVTEKLISFVFKEKNNALQAILSPDLTSDERSNAIATLGLALDKFSIKDSEGNILNLKNDDGGYDQTKIIGTIKTLLKLNAKTSTAENVVGKLTSPRHMQNLIINASVDVMNDLVADPAKDFISNLTKKVQSSIAADPAKAITDALIKKAQNSIIKDIESKAEKKAQEPPSSEKVFTQKGVMSGLSKVLESKGVKGLSERLNKANATDLNKIIKLYDVSDQFTLNTKGNITLKANGGKQAVAAKLASLIEVKNTPVEDTPTEQPKAGIAKNTVAEGLQKLFTAKKEKIESQEVRTPYGSISVKIKPSDVEKAYWDGKRLVTKADQDLDLAGLEEAASRTHLGEFEALENKKVYDNRRREWLILEDLAVKIDFLTKENKIVFSKLDPGSEKAEAFDMIYGAVEAVQKKLGLSFDTKITVKTNFKYKTPFNKISDILGKDPAEQPKAEEGSAEVQPKLKTFTPEQEKTLVHHKEEYGGKHEQIMRERMAEGMTLEQSHHAAEKQLGQEGKHEPTEEAPTEQPKAVTQTGEIDTNKPLAKGVYKLVPQRERPKIIEGMFPGVDPSQIHVFSRQKGKAKEVLTQESMEKVAAFGETYDVGSQRLNQAVKWFLSLNKGQQNKSMLGRSGEWEHGSSEDILKLANNIINAKNIKDGLKIYQDAVITKTAMEMDTPDFYGPTGVRDIIDAFEKHFKLPSEIQKKILKETEPGYFRLEKAGSLVPGVKPPKTVDLLKTDVSEEFSVGFGNDIIKVPGYSDMYAMVDNNLVSLLSPFGSRLGSMRVSGEEAFKVEQTSGVKAEGISALTKEFNSLSKEDKKGKIGKVLKSKIKKLRVNKKVASTPKESRNITNSEKEDNIVLSDIDVVDEDNIDDFLPNLGIVKIKDEYFTVDNESGVGEEITVDNAIDMANEYLESIKPKEKSTLANEDENVVDDEDYEYMEAVSKEMATAEDAGKIQVLINRFSELFPFVEVRKVLNVAPGKIGSASFREVGDSLQAIIEWKENGATPETIPHEFSHIYIELFSDAKLVKLGVKRYKRKEDLVINMSKYYMGTLENQKEVNWLRSWLRRFWLMVKTVFGGNKVKKDAVAGLIMERMAVGKSPYGQMVTSVKRKGSVFKVGMDENGMVSFTRSENIGENTIDLSNPFYMADVSNSEVAPDLLWDADIIIENDMGVSELFKDGNVAVFTERFYNKHYKVNLKTEELLGMKNIAIDYRHKDDFEGFQKSMNAYVKEKYPKSELNLDTEIKKKRHEIFLKSFFLRENSRTPISYLDKSFGRIKFILKQHRDKSISLMPQSLNEDGYNLNPATGKQLKSIFTQNFLEEQKLGGDDIRFIYVDKVDISKEIIVDKKEMKTRWISGDGDIKATADWISKIDTQLAKDFSKGKKKGLIFFFSAKSGDSKSIIFSFVPKKWQKISKDNFLTRMEEEFNNGHLTRDHVKSMLSYGKSQESKNKHIWSQIYTRFRMFQKIKGNRVLMRLKGKAVQDFLNRLRVDFTEGTVIRGLGESKIMMYDPEEIVVKVPNEEGELTDVPLFGADGKFLWDGWLLTSSSWFKRAGDKMGQQATAVKTMIRHIGNGGYDYLISKHMNFNVFKGMEFYHKGQDSPFAKVVGTGKDTNIVIFDENGLEIDRVDFMAANGVNKGNEIKDSDGEYTKLYTPLPLKEEDIRVLFLGAKAKNQAAHPTVGHELSLSSTIENEPAGVEYLNAVKEHYSEVVNHYMDLLFEFSEKPQVLRDFLYKEVQDGALPTELQTYLDIFPDGKGLFIPQVMNQIIPMLNTSLISNGVHKAKQPKGMATRLYLKPRVGLNIDRGNVIVSNHNTTLMNLVKAKVMEEEGWDEFPIKSPHGTVKRLNQWLEENELHILIHRSPLQKWTSLQPRKLQQFVEGNHGQTVFMHEDDVFIVHEADFDGDSAALEAFPDSNGLIEKLYKAMDTEEFKKRDKSLALKMFKGDEKEYSLASMEDYGEVTSQNTNAWDSQGMVVNFKTITSILDYKDVKVKGNQGDYYLRVRNLDEVVYMSYIELDGNMHEDLFNLIMSNNDRIVYKTEVEDKKVVIEIESYEELQEVKDLEDIKFHLKTTLEHELSNVFQMAMDNPKLGLLNAVGWNGSRWLVNRVFKKIDDSGNEIKGSLSKADKKVAWAIYKTFNYSPIRQGRGELYRESLSFNQNINQSTNLALEFYDSDGNDLSTDEINANLLVTVDDNTRAKRGRKKGKRVTRFKENKSWKYLEIEDVITNGKITPLESLLSEMGRIINSRGSESGSLSKDWLASPLQFTKNSYKYAHIKTMQEIDRKMSPYYNNILKSGNKDRIIPLGKAVKFMDAMGNEFTDIFAKATEKIEDIDDIEQTITLDYLYNEDFIAFIEKYINEYSALSDEQKAYGTLYYLSGISKKNKRGRPTKAAFVLKLLPIQLLHSGVLEKYGALFHERLQDEEKYTPRESDARYNFKFVPMMNIAEESKSCG